MTESPARGRTGRRAGDSGTREAIAAAARELFAATGYDRTTVRGIAAAAGVDPALVTHFYGSKDQLFLATVSPPFDPAEAVEAIRSGPREQIGERVAAVVVRALESEQGRRAFLGMVRCAASEPAAAELVRAVVHGQVLVPLAAGLGLDRPELRAALAGSQVVGLVLARHVVELAPLVDLGADELVRLLAPVFQHWFAAEDAVRPGVRGPRL